MSDYPDIVNLSFIPTDNMILLQELLLLEMNNDPINIERMKKRERKNEKESFKRPIIYEKKK